MALYREFAEQTYAAGWLQVGPSTIQEFRQWLDVVGLRDLQAYETEALPALREVYETYLAERHQEDGQ